MSASLFAILPHVLFSTRTFGAPHAADPLTVMPFLALARELAALLIPVQPRPQFRADLERSLMGAARQQNARGALVQGEPLEFVEREGTDRRWVIGAAAAAAVGSAMSVAGIVTYVWWHRREPGRVSTTQTSEVP